MEERIIEIIKESLDREEIKPEDELIGLGGDELDRMEIAMELEDRYGISIPTPDIEAWVTVKDVIDYMMAHTPN